MSDDLTPERLAQWREDSLNIFEGDWDPDTRILALIDALESAREAVEVGCAHPTNNWPDNADDWTPEAWRRHAEYLRGRVHVHMHRAERAEAKLAKVRELAERPASAITRDFDGVPWPAFITIDELRAALTKGEEGDQ